MASYLAALQSVIPKLSSPPVAPFPSVGSRAPSSASSSASARTVPLSPSGPTLVAFVRHCGCPFAEREVRALAAAVRAHPHVKVVVVQHSEEHETRRWWESVGGPDLFPSGSCTLLSDPSFALYAQWGIGQLGWFSLVNGGVMRALSELKRGEGIDLRPTGRGSYRWLSSGGFAVDKDGVVRWAKLARQSSDMCDYEEAVKTVV